MAEKRAQGNLELLREDVAKAIEMWSEETMFQGSAVRILEIGDFNEDGLLDLTFTLIAKTGE